MPYASYRTLPGIFVEFLKFVKDMGTADQIGDVVEAKHKNKSMCPLGFA